MWDANLAIFNKNEFEINGSKFISGHCRRCGTKILPEVIEKNIEKWIAQKGWELY